MQIPLFPLGQVFITPGALAVDIDFSLYLHRHQSGDWGDLDREDRAENNFSLKTGLRVLSAYHTSAGVKFWIITEADRSATTILLPSEY